MAWLGTPHDGQIVRQRERCGEPGGSGGGWVAGGWTGDGFVQLVNFPGAYSNFKMALSQWNPNSQNIGVLFFFPV